MRFACLLLLIASPLAAQKRAITFEDYIALKAVSDPQLSPDGKWVAYTVSTPSLQDNRNVARVWIAEVATGQSRQLTGSRAGRPTGRRSPSSRRVTVARRSGFCQSAAGMLGRCRTLPMACPIRRGCPMARGSSS